MNITIPRVLSKKDLVDFLITLPEFPSYVTPNWDSIEECLADFIAEHGGEVKINNEISSDEVQ